MAYRASRVKLSYDFTRTVPTDNPKYLAYQEFRQKFGEDGNLLVIGVQTDKLFQKAVFFRLYSPDRGPEKDTRGG